MLCFHDIYCLQMMCFYFVLTVFSTVGFGEHFNTPVRGDGNSLGEMKFIFQAAEFHHLEAQYHFTPLCVQCLYTFQRC